MPKKIKSTLALKMSKFMKNEATQWHTLKSQYLVSAMDFCFSANAAYIKELMWSFFVLKFNYLVMFYKQQFVDVYFNLF